MLYTSCLGYKIWKYNTSPKYLFAVGSVSLVEFKVNKHFTEIKIISKLAFQLNTNYETKT